MVAPFYFVGEPRDPLPPEWHGWFDDIQDCVAKISATSAATTREGDFLTLRSEPSARFIAVGVLVRRVRSGVRHPLKLRRWSAHGLEAAPPGRTGR
jgi:hypothetical protein